MNHRENFWTVAEPSRFTEACERHSVLASTPEQRRGVPVQHVCAEDLIARAAQQVRDRVAQKADKSRGWRCAKRSA